MRRGLFLALLTVLVLCGTARAQDPAFACVREFVADTPYAREAATDAGLQTAADLLRERLGLVDLVLPLDAGSAAAWCELLEGPDGDLFKQVARLSLTAVDPSGIDNVDDGIGPMPFDFQPYKLAARYDGVTCRFIIAGPLRKAEGLFTVAGGRLRIHGGKWWIGGGAATSVFDRFNLALTEEGSLVGKFATFLNAVQPGEVAQETHTVTLDGKRTKLGADLPTGAVKMPVDVKALVNFHVVSCTRDAGTPP